MSPFVERKQHLSVFCKFSFLPQEESSSDEGVIDKTPVKKAKEGPKLLKNSDGDEVSFYPLYPF